MNGEYSLKAKAEGSIITRPRSALSTRPSRPDRGLTVGASVAFLTGRRCRFSNQLGHVCGRVHFFRKKLLAQIRHAGKANHFGVNFSKVLQTTINCL